MEDSNVGDHSEPRLSPRQVVDELGLLTEADDAHTTAKAGDGHGTPRRKEPCKTTPWQL